MAAAWATWTFNIGVAEIIRRTPDLIRGKAGWSPERRARAAARIRLFEPWRRSTGPRTEAGKAKSSANALKHGLRSRACIESKRQVRHILRVSAANLATLRTWLRARRAGIAPATLVGLQAIPPLFQRLAGRREAGLPRRSAKREGGSPNWYWPIQARAGTFHP